MSSIDVAEQATSARPYAPVVARETLFSGAVVKIRVAADAHPGVYAAEEEPLHFLRFARTVRGGRINCFLHTEDKALCGSTVTASASLHKKTLEDGREFLYVDLKPVEDDTPVTHGLGVMTVDDVDLTNCAWPKFLTPAPVQGVVIFGPPPEPKPKKVKKPRTTGDSQLDRLLAQGWQIESETASRVKLFRMKGDERREMFHNRPKQKKSK